jgi:hypothetical protein
MAPLDYNKIIDFLRKSMKNPEEEAEVLVPMPLFIGGSVR